MKTMFKKTLVAAALAGFGFSAFAAQVDGTAVNISKQGSVATPELTAGAFTVTPEAAYAIGDTVVINFTGGLKTAPITITSDGANAVTLGRTGLTATAATYRVTQVIGNGAAHGDFVFGGADAFEFTTATVIALGSVKATYAAFLGNTSSTLDTPVVYDTDEDLTSTSIFTVRDQFVAAITSANRFNGILDVGADREKFTGAVDTDVLTIGLTDRSGDTGAVAKGNTTFKVNGDFSWVGVVADAVTVACSGAAVGTPTVTASSLTFTCNAASNSAVLTLDIDQAGDPVAVSPTTFTVDTTHAYGAGSLLAQSTLAAGEWTVNGSNITVPYMVYGTLGEKTFSQVINLTNTGVQTGTIYADVWATDAAGKSVKVLTNQKLGTSYPKATAKLAGPLKDAMAAAATPFVNGTVAIRLITDVEEAGVSVYSAYVDNTTSERAIVNNDSPVTQK
ncbi:MAG: hypothetical protein KKB00_16635 [Gammaproteobacteria bacterium]|nr:hypothetical protein [Gammaproteobacteria bacterium]